MKKLLLLIVCFGTLHLAAANLIVECRFGADVLQDISVIGKWIYVGKNLQLLDKHGNILATEPLNKIKKITIAIADSAIENIQDNSVVVYPNPSHDILMIRGIEAQTLRIYDLHGLLIKTENGTQVHVNDLADGGYLWQIGTQVVKFIKN